MTSPAHAIIPTIGRRVWYWPSEGELSPLEMMNPPGQLSQVQPFDAGVVFVHPNGTVNLLVTDHRGVSRPRVDVPFLAEGAAPTPERGWAQWMPYQVGQSKKDEADRMDAAKDSLSVASQHLAGAWAMVVGSNDLEQQIKAVGADKAPRVTPAALKAEIVSEHYHSPAQAGDQAWSGDKITDRLDTLTFCVLVLRNGYTVVGHSACASPENFNAKIGRGIARENAERQIWPLLGFRLRDKLAGKE